MDHRRGSYDQSVCGLFNMLICGLSEGNCITGLG